MDVNDSKPTQDSPNMVANYLSTQKTSDLRRKIVSHMEKVIKQIFPTGSQSQIQNLSLNLEEKVFAAAISREDYLQRVTMKLGSMKTPVPPTAAENPGDQVGSRGSQGQFHKPEQPFQNPLATQSLEHQQLSTQNCLNNTTPSSIPMNLPNHSNKQQQQNQILKQNVNSPASMQSSPQSIMHGSLAMLPSLTQMKALSVQLQDQQSLQQSTQSIDRNLSQSILKLHQQSQSFPFVNTEKPPLEQPVLPFQKRSQLTGQLQGQEGCLNVQQSGVSEVQNQKKILGKDYHSTTQLRTQSNVSRMLGTQSGKSDMGSFQSTQMKQQAEVSMQQQAPQTKADLLLTRGQQSQPEPLEHKLVSQARSPSANFLEHPNLMLEEMKQAVEVSDSLFEAQQLVILRKQLLQSKNTLPAVLANLKFESGQVDEDTWQEEIYQWIQTLKKLFLPELKEQCYKIVACFRQIGSAPEPQTVGDREKRNKLYHFLMEFVKFLEVPRHRIQSKHKQLIAKLEKELINLFKSRELRKPMSLQQHNQLPLPTVPPFQQQSSHTQSQNPHHLDTNMLQSMQLKQQGSTKAQLREQQYPQDQVKQQLLKQKWKREMLNVQQPPELHAHQKPQGTHMNVTEVMNVKQEMGDMRTLIQHHFSSQQPFNNQEQVKLEPPSPVSSPQLLQRTSVQLAQNPSPKKKQKNLQTSPAKPGNLVTEVMNVKQVMNMGTHMQHHFSSHQPFNIRQHVKLESPSPISSPQLFQGPSIQLPQNPSPKKTQTNLQTSAKTGNPTGVPQASGPGTAGTSLIVTTPGIAASHLSEASVNIGDNPGNFSEIGCHESSAIEQPLQRLLRVVNSMSTTLGASVEAMASVVGIVERMAGSVHGMASTAALGEDLAAMTRSHLHERNSTKDGLIAGTSDSEISELESSAAFPNKRTKMKANNSLMEEIRKINQRLINTVVEISDENANSTTASFAEANQAKIVKCSFIAVSTTQNFESAHASENLLPIQPLKLLIPGNYPNHSPLVLDKFSALASSDNEDLTVKAISRLNLSLRSFQQPFSLEQIAKAWDACAYCVVREYAEQHGGGNFSSRFGMWENCPCLS